MRTILPAAAHLIPEHAERVFKGQIFDVYQWQQKLFDGTEATFEMLRRPDTVEVIAIKDHQLVVLNELQPNWKKSLNSLPGGRHDHPEENELDAAKRELHEETGMTFTNWRLLRVVQPIAKLEWFIYTFLATDFESQEEVHLDAGEKIELELVDRDRALLLAAQTRPGYLPADLLEQVSSVDELADLPQFAA